MLLKRCKLDASLRLLPLPLAGFRLKRWLVAQFTSQSPWPVLKTGAWEWSNWGYVPIEFVLQVSVAAGEGDERSALPARQGAWA